jgi:hypothetical protein
MAKRKNKINSIVAPLTPGRMKKEIGAETRMKYGELGRDLQGDLRASGQDIRNTNSWFAQYQNRMNPVRDEQAAGTANLQDEMRKNASYLSGWNQNQSQATGASEDRSAAIRGAVADPTAASRDEAADTQRQALLASSRDRAALIGESTGGYLRGVTAASELGRQADVRGIRNTIAETRSKVRDLKREKGDFRVARAGEKRGEERDWNIQNRTFAAGRADAANANALDWATENRLSSGSGSGESSGGSRGSSGYSPREAVSFIRQKLAKDEENWKYVANAPGEYVDYLVNRGVSRGAAKAAVRRFIRAKKRNRKPDTINDVKGGTHR